MSSEAEPTLVDESSEKLDFEAICNKAPFLDKYVLMAPLAEGGYGKAYVASRKGDGSTVVVKTILVEHAKKKGVSREECQREAIALAKCRNLPYIVNLFDVYEEETDGKLNLILVMEPLLGGNLQEALEKTKGGLPAEQVQAIMSKLISAVYYMTHHLGILHRDLKPENIGLELPDSNLDVKLLDFGFARWTEKTDDRFSNVGTLAYKAPELQCGNHGNTKESEIFAIGAIWLVLLTNCEDDLKNLQFNPTDGTLNLASFLLSKFPNDATRELALRMLNKYPKNRPDFEEILNHRCFADKHPLEDPNLSSVFSFKEMFEAQKVTAGLQARLHNAHKEIFELKARLSCIGTDGEATPHDALKQVLSLSLPPKGTGFKPQEQFCNQLSFVVVVLVLLIVDEGSRDEKESLFKAHYQLSDENQSKIIEYLENSKLIDYSSGEHNMTKGKGGAKCQSAEEHVQGRAKIGRFLYDTKKAVQENTVWDYDPKENYDESYKLDRKGKSCGNINYFLELVGFDFS